MFSLCAGACGPSGRDDDRPPDELAVVRLGGEVIGVERTWREDLPEGLRAVTRRQAYAVAVRGRALSWEVEATGVVDGEGRLRSGRLTRDGVAAELDVAGAWWLPEARGLLSRVAAGEAETVSAWWPSLEATLPTRLEPAPGGVRVDAGIARSVLEVDAAGAIARTTSGALTVEVAPTAPRAGKPPELMTLLRLPLASWPDARRARHATWRVRGLAPEDLHFPPLQVADGERVEVRAPLLLEVPRRLPEPGPELAAWRGAEPGIPVGSPEIVALAADLPGAEDSHARLRALIGRVQGALRGGPQPGLPDVDAALRAGRGDCSEHSAVFVALARTIGWPARPVTGWVYLDDGVEPGMYPHAWVEVWLGEVGWVPVDPSLGQTIADAGHLRARAGVAGLARPDIVRIDAR